MFGNKKWLNSFTVSMLLSAISFLIYAADLPLFYLFELKSYDLKVYMRGERPVSDQVVIVAIDEKSLAKEGRWPWPRTKLAQLVDKLSEVGVAVIGFDIFFPEKDVYIPMEDVKRDFAKRDFSNATGESITEWLEEAGNSDAIFSEAIANSQRSVLGFVVDSNESSDGKKWSELDEDTQGLLSFYEYSIVQRVDKNASTKNLQKIQSFNLSIPELGQMSNSQGYASFNPEVDGVVRWVPMVMEAENHFFPPMTLQILQQGTQIPLALRIGQFGVNRLWVGDVTIPVTESGNLLVNYYGPAKTFKHYSVTDVLSGAVGAEQLSNKLVLLGTTAVGTHDTHTTPHGPMYPGIEVHTTILENILQQDFLKRPDWLTLLDIGVIIASGLTFGVASLFARAFVLSLILLVGVGSYMAFDWYLFVEKGLWVESIHPIFTQVFVYSGIMIFRVIFEEKQKRFIQKAFSKYLSPELVEELVKRPELLKAGGEDRFMSIMFTDLADFTNISEKLTPAELADLMNDYLTEMTEFVLEEEGTVNQYAGDAIMASYGAPVPKEDHADRAVRAGLKMLRKLDQIQDKYKPWHVTSMRCRIGVNSGPMYFGNLGSNQVYYYSVLGDPVNLGARLESLNKQYGTYFAISEFTRDCLTPGLFRMRLLDYVKVKGKQKPVFIYEVYGYGDEEINEELLEYYDEYEVGFRAYLEKDFVNARKKFERCLRLRPENKAAIRILERVRNLQYSDVGEDWDGSVSLTEK
jgi:adenylate cyclase